MSEIKVNKLSARTSNAITIGDTSDVVSTNTAATFKVTREATRSITGDGSTSSAVDITSAVTEVDATSGAAPVTLADGSTNGQIKTIINVSTSGTNAITITPSNLRGYTSIVLNAPGETVTCMFKNSNWNIIAGNGYTTA